MEAVSFLEYLSEAPATHELAEGLAHLMRLRGRPDLVPGSMTAVELQRVAS